MRSMTGFGGGEHPVGTGKVSVDIRALNHRFLDVRVRMPRELLDLAGFVEHLCRERLSRGRVEVAVRVDGVALGAPRLDRARARAAWAELTALRDELAPGAQVPLSLLSLVPDLFAAAEGDSQGPVREALRAAFTSAADELDTMREREGQALARDLGARVDVLRGIAAAVTKRAPEVVEQHRKRLKERADRLRASLDAQLDETRLEQEIALFADRSDIAEELTRLGIHTDQLAGLLVESGPIGRKIDFLLQELTREVNTIGSKSADASIAHAVVDMKAEIERMREQVQNVE